MTERDEAHGIPGQELLHRGISRRGALKAGAFAGAAFFAAHATGNYGLVQAAAKQGLIPPSSSVAVHRSRADDFDDTPIDPVAVMDGSAGWFPSRYGPGDELGAINEITPQKTLEAWRLIKNNKNKPPKTYSLGELMEPGIPAYPGRAYEQTLNAPSTEPPYAGDNMLNGSEERISTTYHIATQLDGLPHIGVGDVFYNGFRASELIAPDGSGVLHLGSHLVPPFITRGILLDVLSVKVEQGASDALGDPVDGKPILANSYRITVEDLQAAMQRAKIRSIEPGDVVVIRTGWTHLFSATDEDKKARYLATEPGIYLREARWLAQFRPAVVASDTWALEVLPPPEPYTTTQLFPVHQELITHHGIRIGEAFRSEDLVADGVHEFVFFYTGQRAKGSTATNVQPGALASPWK